MYVFLIYEINKVEYCGDMDMVLTNIMGLDSTTLRLNNHFLNEIAFATKNAINETVFECTFCELPTIVSNSFFYQLTF